MNMQLTVINKTRLGKLRREWAPYLIETLRYEQYRPHLEYAERVLSGRVSNDNRQIYALIDDDERAGSSYLVLTMGASDVEGREIGFPWKLCHPGLERDSYDEIRITCMSRFVEEIVAKATALKASSVALKLERGEWVIYFEESYHQVFVDTENWLRICNLDGKQSRENSGKLVDTANTDEGERRDGAPLARRVRNKRRADDRVRPSRAAQPKNRRRG